MSTKQRTYAERVSDLAKLIQNQADTLRSLESERAKWSKPEGKTFTIGSVSYYVVQTDGSVTPELASVQREALAVHDRLILATHSKLEGLRWQLLQLGKEGSAQ